MQTRGRRQRQRPGEIGWATAQALQRLQRVPEQQPRCPVSQLDPATSQSGSLGRDEASSIEGAINSPPPRRGRAQKRACPRMCGCVYICMEKRDAREMVQMVVSYSLRLGVCKAYLKRSSMPALACLFPHTLARSGSQLEDIHAPVPAHTRAPVLPHHKTKTKRRVHSVPHRRPLQGMVPSRAEGWGCSWSCIHRSRR